MSKKITIIFTTLGVILLVLGLFFKSQKNDQIAEQEKKAVNAELVRAHSFATGKLDSKVVLVEFYDPECEACKAFHPAVSKIVQAFGDRIKFVPRPVALHSSSEMAIRLTYAAGKEGKFYEMFNLLLERQDEWGHKPFPPLDLFIKYATEVGLDTSKVKSVMDSDEIKEMMRLDSMDSNALGVRGTPTFFVNGKMLEELSPQNLEAMITQALSEN